MADDGWNVVSVEPAKPGADGWDVVGVEPAARTTPAVPGDSDFRVPAPARPSSMPGEPGFDPTAPRPASAAPRPLPAQQPAQTRYSPPAGGAPSSEWGPLVQLGEHVLTQGGRMDPQTAMRRLGRDVEAAGLAIAGPEYLTGKGAAETLGLGVSGAKHVAQTIGEHLPSPISGIKNAVGLGGQGKKALSDLATSIKSGRYGEDVVAGKQAATDAEIRSLRENQQITEADARAAIQANREASGPGLVALRQQRDLATRTAEQITRGFEAAPSTEKVGQSLLNRVNTHIQGLKGDRSSVAEAMYSEADGAMMGRHAGGDTFQASAPGERLIKELTDKLSVEGGAGASTAEQALIRDQILPNIRGARVEATEGEQAAESAKAAWAKLTGTPYEKPAEFASKEPKVIREVLRKLRDAASGNPEEGYAAIGQERAGSYAKKLAASLEQWEPSLAEADARYKTMSEALNPSRTALGRKATAGEKFDRDQLATGPSTVPGMFFKTPESVRQLVTLSGGDRGPVEIEALNWARRNLADKKTPEAMREWLREAEWMTETPRARQVVAQEIERFNQATTAAKTAATRLKSGAENYAARVGEQRKMAETAAAETAKGTEKAQKALADWRGTVDRLKTNVESGNIRSEDLPKRLRTLLGSKEATGSVPPDTLARLNAEINDIEATTSREQRRLKVLKWIAGLTAAGVVGGEATHLGRGLL